MLFIANQDIYEYVSVDALKKFLFGFIEKEYGYVYHPLWHWDIDALESVYILNSKSFFGVCYDEVDNRIVGTLAARPYDKEYVSLKGKYNSLTTASLWRHYVDPNYRRRGYATCLYHMCEKFLSIQDFENIYLHVQDNGSGSLEYRKTHGFSETFRENDEWKTIHMEKFL